MSLSILTHLNISLLAQLTSSNLCASVPFFSLWSVRDVSKAVIFQMSTKLHKRSLVSTFL